MIYLMSRAEEKEFPDLFHSMFKQRADQFVYRQKWQLAVNAKGEEIDIFDTPHAIYIMVSSDQGELLGSARLLPTTFPTLVNTVFIENLESREIIEPNTWECSRFCISPNAPKKTVIELLFAISSLGRSHGIHKCIAVFDKRMKRTYQRYGILPEIICDCDENECGIGIGMWAYSTELHENLRFRTGDKNENASTRNLVRVSALPCVAQFQVSTRTMVPPANQPLARLSSEELPS